MFLAQLYTPPQTEVHFLVYPQVSTENCFFYSLIEEEITNSTYCEEHSISNSLSTLNFNYIFSNLSFKFVTSNTPSEYIDINEFQAFFYPILVTTINGEIANSGENDFCILSRKQATCHYQENFFTILIPD